jgi:hypothetical protein
MDVLAKTVRTRRPEYDTYLLGQLDRAVENEERLLAAVAPVVQAGGAPAAVA